MLCAWDHNSHSDTNSNKQCKQGYAIYGICYVQWLFVRVCMLLNSSKKHVLFTHDNCQLLCCLPDWSIQCMVLFFRKKKKKKKRTSQIILCIWLIICKLRVPITQEIVFCDLDIECLTQLFNYCNGLIYALSITCFINLEFYIRYLYAWARPLYNITCDPIIYS